MRIATVCLVAASLTACGAASTANPQVRSADAVAPATTSTSTTNAPDPVAPVTGRRAPSECLTVQRTVETAIEAFFAEHGRDITAADELVEAGLLRELDPSFEIDTTAEIPEVRPAPGGGCDDDDEAELQHEQQLADGDLCWAEAVVLEVAVAAYAATTGRMATSMDDLDTLYGPIDRDEFRNATVAPDGSVIDTSRGACPEMVAPYGFGDGWEDAPPECAVDYAIVDTAAALLLQLTGERPVSVRSLVDAGYVEDRPYRYDVDDGDLVDVSGSGCPVLDPWPSTEACDVEQRTLETAIEAYIASTGTAPPSLQTLVDEQYLREVPTGWTLLVASEPGAVPIEFEVVPVAGGACDSTG